MAPIPAYQREGFARSAGGFWPQFPHGAVAAVHEMTLNGVDLVSEHWETAASAADVIAYYREQMAARGWRDVTEESFELSPEMRNNGTGSTGLQNQEYAAKYRKILESSLVLNHGPQCLQINAVPEENKTGWIDVRICAAATPSIKDFIESLAAIRPDDGKDGPARGPIDAVQHNGGQRYHTTITAQPDEPAPVFQRTLADLQSQGWQLVLTKPAQNARADYFACLSRDKQYAVLFVRASTDNRGASVTFTEVAPE